MVTRYVRTVKAFGVADEGGEDPAIRTR